jgi:hypothetical protein
MTLLRSFYDFTNEQLTLVLSIIQWERRNRPPVSDLPRQPQYQKPSSLSPYPAERVAVSSPRTFYFPYGYREILHFELFSGCVPVCVFPTLRNKTSCSCVPNSRATLLKWRQRTFRAVAPVFFIFQVGQRGRHK